MERQGHGGDTAQRHGCPSTPVRRGPDRLDRSPRAEEAPAASEVIGLRLCAGPTALVRPSGSSADTSRRRPESQRRPTRRELGSHQRQERRCPPV